MTDNPNLVTVTFNGTPATVDISKVKYALRVDFDGRMVTVIYTFDHEPEFADETTKELAERFGPGFCMIGYDVREEADRDELVSIAWGAGYDAGRAGTKMPSRELNDGRDLDRWFHDNIAGRTAYDWLHGVRGRVKPELTLVE